MHDNEKPRINKESQSFTLAFAVGICLVAAGVLSFVGTQLQPKQEANAQFDKQKNTLIALKLGRDGARYNTEQVKLFYSDTADQAITQQLYDKYIRQVVVNTAQGVVVADRTHESIQPDDTDLAPAWLLMRDNKVEALAIDAIGKGLWSTLYGFFALEGDYETVRGITFYQHGETAGLGDRITESWFQENFVGKKVYTAAGELQPVAVAKSKAPEGSDHIVDGISGATLTCNGVTALLAAELQRYSKWFANERAALASPDAEVDGENEAGDTAAEVVEPSSEETVAVAAQEPSSKDDTATQEAATNDKAAPQEPVAAETAVGGEE